MTDWKEVKIKDICLINKKSIGKNFPYKVIEYLDTGSLTRGVILSFQRYLLHDAPSRAKRIVEDGDILYSTVRPNQEHYGILKNVPQNAIVSTGFVTLTCKPTANSYFVYYYLTQKWITEYLHSLAEGSTTTYPSLKPEDIAEVELDLPPLPEQRAIAEVLSSLDDKIDLLHRNNKTLEEMAEVLFRKWFMEDVDETYTEKPLDEIASYLNGLALQKYLPKEGEEPLVVIKIKEMNNGISENSDYCSSNLPEQYIVNPGDILFSWSGSLEIMIWTQSKGALNQHLFKVTSDIYPKWMIYFATKHFIPLFRDIAADKATTMGHIQRKHLSEALLAIPPGPLLKTIDAIIDPIFEKLIQNKINIHHLVNTRDLLLPKLMSGAVRVKTFVNEFSEP